MKRILIFMLALGVPVVAQAQDVASTDDASAMIEEMKGTAELPYDGAEITLDQFTWQSRPIIVFADSELDPAFRQQMEFLREGAEDLMRRDVVVVTDTDPAGRSEVRSKLRPHGFMLVVIGKNGQIALRKPRPWTVREITRIIDNMPIRQQEVRDQWRGR